MTYWTPKTLPCNMKWRQKQYAYDRHLLLGFPKLQEVLA